MTTSAVEFSERQELFRKEIDPLKRRLEPGIQWYPYQTLSLPLELLRQSERLLSDGLAGGLVADLACADGRSGVLPRAFGLPSPCHRSPAGELQPHDRRADAQREPGLIGRGV